MLFKVYGQNCVRPKGKRIVEVKDISPYMDEVFNEALDLGLIDIGDDDVDDSKVSAAYEKIEEYWRKNNRLECGDYYITEVDSRDDVVIPNMVGGCVDIIF